MSLIKSSGHCHNTCQFLTHSNMIPHTLPFLETTAQFREVFNFFFDKSLLILWLYCLHSCLPQLLLFYFILLMLILWSNSVSAQLSATVSDFYVYLPLVIFWSDSVSAQLSATVSDFYVYLLCWSCDPIQHLHSCPLQSLASLLIFLKWSCDPIQYLHPQSLV